MACDDADLMPAWDAEIDGLDMPAAAQSARSVCFQLA
jgi:hypothetical protein